MELSEEISDGDDKEEGEAFKHIGGNSSNCSSSSDDNVCAGGRVSRKQGRGGNEGIFSIGRRKRKKVKSSPAAGAREGRGGGGGDNEKTTIVAESATIGVSGPAGQAKKSESQPVVRADDIVVVIVIIVVIIVMLSSHGTHLCGNVCCDPLRTADWGTWHVILFPTLSHGYALDVIHMLAY